MKKLKLFKLNNSYILASLLSVVLVGVFFAFSNEALAEEGHSELQEKILLGLGWIFYTIATWVGKLTTFFIGWLMQVASWDKFVEVPAVETGWVIMRDLSNMFFILILLLISFGTILRRENYNISKLLPKVIIMAVLINFSKTICGVIIEFSQVVMMTFVRPFTANGASQMVDLLGMNHMWSYVQQQEDKNNLNFSTIGGVLVAMFASMIAMVVVLTAIAIFLVRIIMLWIYIVLSPLAYLLFAFPQGQKYASEWWGDFIKYVTSGPILAFFIWLALSTSASSANQLSKLKIADQGIDGGVFSEFLSDEVFSIYLITIAFLFGGLMITARAGGVIGKVAGTGMGYIQKGKDIGLKGSKNFAKGTAKWAGRNVGLKTVGALRHVGSNNIVSNVGQMATDWRGSLVKSREKAAIEKRHKRLKSMGMDTETIKKVGKINDSTVGRFGKAGVAGAVGAGAVMAGAPIAVPVLATLAAAVSAFSGVSTIRRESRKKKIKEKYDQEAKQLRDNKKLDLEDIDHEKDTGAINADEHKSRKNDISQTYNDSMKELNKKFRDDMKQIKKQEGNWFTQNPGRVTAGAVEKATKDSDNANKRVGVLASGSQITDFSASTFYSSSGQTDSQKEFFKSLSSETDEAKNALSEIAKTMTRIRDTGGSKSELKAVESFKQGIASYRKGGGNADNLSELVDIVNDIKTGDGSNPNHESSVEDFEEKVI